MTEHLDAGSADAGHLALVATSFRRVGLGPLARFTLGPDDAAGRRALRAALGAEELVYLATCNRVECYASFPQEAPPPDVLVARARAFFAPRVDVGPADLFARAGRDAAEHLLAVASGLDSLILGETEVSGQARRAHDLAAAASLSGPALARLFDRAAACSRRVKNETSLGRAPSAASIAVEKVRRHFGADGPRVTVFVGAGEMTRKAAEGLRDAPGERIFVNRTRARADELARRFGGQARSLEELQAAPPPRIDLLFAATAATETVVPAAVLAPSLAARARERIATPLVVCDLGLPRDVDPAVDALPGVVVVDMASIQSWVATAERAASVQAEAAREIVRAEAARLAREERFRREAERGARALLAGRLGHLSPVDRSSFLRFGVGLAARLCRQPA